MKTLLLFDIDGTLLYSDRIDSRCFASSYEATFGRPFPTIDWTRFPQVTDHVIFRTAYTAHFGREASQQERQAFEDHYIDQLRTLRRQRPHDFREVAGAVALWQQLARDERFVLGIATGGWRAPALVKLAHVGIDPLPPYAAYADGMESRADILAAAIALARAEHDIDHIVYVGDAVWDVLTTSQMGLPLVGVRREGDHELLYTAGADIVITDFQQPGAFLEAVNAARKQVAAAGTAKRA